MNLDVEGNMKDPSYSYPETYCSLRTRRRSRRFRFLNSSDRPLLHGACLIALFVILTSTLLYARRKDHTPQYGYIKTHQPMPSPVRLRPAVPSSIPEPGRSQPSLHRKTLVMASYMSQDMSWLEGMPPRYVRLLFEPPFVEDAPVMPCRTLIRRLAQSIYCY